MRFRTEIDIRRSPAPLKGGDTLVSLGSCFSRAIGSRLARGGIDIDVTPMGVLFNPVSIGAMVSAMTDCPVSVPNCPVPPVGRDSLYRDSDGVYHALQYESRRQDKDPDRLLAALNADFETAAARLRNADCWLVTFGTAWCFRHLPTDTIVGNCHKLPDSQFERHLCDVDEITALWHPLVERARRVVFTVSPVRHLNDGLHGNTLSKSRLHLAVEQLVAAHDNADYFPAYEALVDDLRDYRFYADDMKHPSEMAEEYIFDLFVDTYYDKTDSAAIRRRRLEARHAMHRPIIDGA